MELELRTVVYAKKVEIRNVPVFACTDCVSYEVLPPVKPDLTECINTLGEQPVKQDVSFGERNELADLFHELLLAWPDATDREMGYRIAASSGGAYQSVTGHYGLRNEVW